jgi:alpha/beta superfamily hydrolase
MGDYQNKQLLLTGQCGMLETVCETNPAAIHSIAAVIAHPHPLFGGTMDNKVVTTLARVYKELGFSQVIRFNFRGVGKSEGQYAEGLGEQEDLKTVVAWAKQTTPAIWLAGFSFGSYVAASVAAAVACQHLTCVAPPVERFAFDKLTPFSCPWLVVQGEQDEVVEAHQVFQWLQGLAHQPSLIRMPTASHFFHGQLLELRAQLVSQLNKQL